MSRSTVLAGDVGGTNVRLALVEADGDQVRIVREQRFSGKAHPSLAAIVRQFLVTAGVPPTRACFGVACALAGDECIGANLPWKVNARELAGETGIAHVKVINDFEAMGHGVAKLGPADVATLQTGDSTARGPIALIGAGTGLGEGYLVWDGRDYQVQASEGGHGDFAPVDDLQFGLLLFLQRQFGHVSRERVLSGPGLEHIYRYLVAVGAAPEQAAVRAEMERGDPAEVVTRHALAGTDVLCQQALALFVKALGAQAGDLALTVAATGGVYLAGGIAPRIVEKLNDGAFLAAFRNKGRMTDLLGRIPVRVILNPSVALLGAAAVAAALSDEGDSGAPREDAWREESRL